MKIPMGGPLVGMFETEGISMTAPAAEQLADLQYKIAWNQLGNGAFAAG